MDGQSGDVTLPRSTIIVGGAFWAVLFAMMAWQLSSVIDLKEAVVRLNGNMETQNAQIRSNALRMDGMENRMSQSERVTDGLRYQVDTLREKR